MEINVIGGALYTQDGKKIADVKDSSIMLVDEPYKQRTMEVAKNIGKTHSITCQLKSLKAVKEKGTKETEFELFKVVENVEAMRLQIIFGEKPEADVRAVLKKNGFKWAPSQGAWQRMLNPAGKYALNRVKEELEAV